MPKSKGARASDLEQLVLQKNRFAALDVDSSSDSEVEENHTAEEEGVVEVRSADEEAITLKSGQAEMRKWNNPESESHVNIFNSPFYKGKRPAFKQNTRPRFVDEEWTSIAEESGAKVTYEDRAPIAREEAKTPTGNTIIFPPEEDTTTAAMWAEKVKECLEKAEAARAKPDDFHESLNRLSFFRRPMAK
jgi:hypothetical protein